MTFQEGDRVILLETTTWIISSNNPAVGSEWYCEGTVSSIHTTGFSVRWDNGFGNSYQNHHDDVAHVNDEILI